jgi:hypothetical protein
MSKILFRRLGWYGGVIFCLIVIAGLLERLLVLRSEPYAVAERFLRTDSCVSKTVGTVRALNLAYLRSNKVKGAGPGVKGDATFTMRVDGQRATLMVTMILEKDLGQWSVISATVNEPHPTSVPGDFVKCNSLP